MFKKNLIICLLILCFQQCLFASPTLKQKIGQMLIFGFEGSSLQVDDEIVNAILQQQIGGVILFDYDESTDSFDRNIKNSAQVKKLIQQLQYYAREAAQSHKNSLTPLFVSIDYEGGNVNRLNERYGFPKTITAEEVSKLKPNAAERYAHKMARTLQELGININFAPVMDVNVNPNNPIIAKLNRSFSNDPNRVTEYAGIFSKAYQQHKVLCVYKHFPGHGSSKSDTHKGFVDVTETWKSSELIPYKNLFTQTFACPMVMTAHVVHYGLDPKGYPASISRAITHDLLRRKLQFKGLVLTDDLQMKAISEQYGTAEAIRLAINAGSNLLIFAEQKKNTGQTPAKIVELIYQEVRAGKIPAARINESYNKIMQIKNYLKS